MGIVHYDPYGYNPGDDRMFSPEVKESQSLCGVLTAALVALLMLDAGFTYGSEFIDDHLSFSYIRFNEAGERYRLPNVALEFSHWDDSYFSLTIKNGRYLNKITTGPARGRFEIRQDKVVGYKLCTQVHARWGGESSALCPDTADVLSYKACHWTNGTKQCNALPVNQQKNGLWLEGTYQRDRYEYVKVQVGPCRNTTQDGQCKPMDEILNLFYGDRNGGDTDERSLTFMYEDTVDSLKRNPWRWNKESTVKKWTAQRTTFGDRRESLVTEVYFEPTSIQVPKRFPRVLHEDIWDSSSHGKISYLKWQREYRYFNSLSAEPHEFAVFYFRLPSTTVEKTYKRTSLQNVCAKIGGYIKFVGLLGVIARLYNQYSGHTDDTD